MSPELATWVVGGVGAAVIGGMVRAAFALFAKVGKLARDLAVLEGRVNELPTVREFGQLESAIAGLRAEIHTLNATLARTN